MGIYFLDSFDKEEAIEISDNEWEVEVDGLAPIPRSSRTGMPSIPSPSKALLVLLSFTIIIDSMLSYIFSGKKTVILAQETTVIPKYVCL